MTTIVFADEYNNGSFDYQLKLQGPDILGVYSIAVQRAWAGEQDGNAMAFLATEHRMLEIYESMATMLNSVDAVERAENEKDQGTSVTR